MIPGAQLVVGDAGRIAEGSIQLPCFHTEHAARARGVASQTILSAGVVPGLFMDIRRGGLDRNFSVALVLSRSASLPSGRHLYTTPYTPPRSRAPKSAFRAGAGCRIAGVHGQVKTLHEYRAGRESAILPSAKSRSFPSGTAIQRNLSAPSDQKSTLRPYGIKPGLAIRLAVSLNTPVCESNGGIWPSASAGISK